MEQQEKRGSKLCVLLALTSTKSFKPNMLVTTGKGEEFPGVAEAEEVFKRIGAEKVEVKETEIRGVLIAKVDLNPLEAASRVRELIKREPDRFFYTKRYIPLEIIVKTSLEEIRKAVEKLADKIGENEKFRVTVEKRHTSLSSKEIIGAVAPLINRKVDLKNPDKIVLIEVLGGLTGVSIVKPEHIVSVKQVLESIV